MATWTNNNPTYYINPAYLTFVENSGYGANLIQVSASSSCYISAFIPDVIDYSDADKNYRRWKVTAYNNKFPDKSKFYIYIRLEKSGSSAMVVYDKILRGVHGGEMVEVEDESGKVTQEEGEFDETHPYFYIHIGEVGETDGTSIRKIAYDTGYLTSNKSNDDKSGVSEMWELDRISTPWLIKAKQWLKGFTVKGFLRLVDGFSFYKSDTLAEKIVSDVKRSIDSDNEYKINNDGEPVLDENGNPVRNDLYVPISDETLPTTKYVSCIIGELDDKFLRKDEDDRSKGTVSSDKGFEVGRFITGIIGGSGAKISNDESSGKTTIEVDRIVGREELVVPKITYNCIDVVTGEQAQSFAFGVIKDVDIKNQIATLDLLEDEYGTLKEQDICRGTFHYLDSSNESSYGVDSNGFYNYSGYTSCYFSPYFTEEDKSLNGKGYMQFHYTLQDDRGSHPCSGMRFYAYGTFDESAIDRQGITYHTREYTRRLDGVTTWKIREENIMSQTGKLDGLNVGGQDMSGYSSFQKNMYITGSVIEFDEQQKEELKGDSAYTAALSEYVGSVRMDKEGNIISGFYRPMNVTLSERNVVSGDENVIVTDYLLQTRVQAFRGGEPLVFSEYVKKGCFTAHINPVGCTAELSNGVISITGISDNRYSYVTVIVNCEGNASFELSYQVKLIKDGVESFVSMVFARTNETPDTPTGGSYKNPVPDKSDVEGAVVWEDSIPAGKTGNERVWVSTCKFWSDGKYPEEAEWSIPRPMTDTSDLEFIYTPETEYKAIPDGFEKDGAVINPEWLVKANAAGWYDNPGEWPADETPDGDWKVRPAFWMATNTARNGVWEGWSIVKVAGERGEKGDGAYMLSTSYSTVVRDSQGNYEPENILVRSMQGSVEKKAYLGMFGFKKGVPVQLSMDNYENPSTAWNISMESISSHDFERVVFRAYADNYPTGEDAWNSPFIGEAGVSFVRDGKEGEDGPMPRNMGKFHEDVAYYYDEEYRDYVWDTTEAGTKVYIRTSRGATYPEGSVKGSVIAPLSNTDYWTEAPRNSLTAIDTALIDEANIAGFVYKNRLMVSQDWVRDESTGAVDATIILDGNTGYFKCENADVTGSVKAGVMSYKVRTGGGNLTGYGMAYGPGNYILPKLSSGEVVEIQAFCEVLSRVAVPFSFRVADDSGFSDGFTVDYIINGVDDKEVWAEKASVVYPQANNLITFVGRGFFEGGTLRNSWTAGGSYGMSGQSVKVTVDAALNETSEYPVQNKVIYAELQKYVTKSGKQDIDGEKNFIGGLKVNNKPIVYDSKGYWYLDGDLIVSGGISMYGNPSGFEPSTIMDGVKVDDRTIVKDLNTGALMINPDIKIDGGEADSVKWSNVEGKPSWLTDDKISYSEINGTPDLEVYAKQKWVEDKGYATTGDLDARIDAIVNGAPDAYDTLKEIADVLSGNVNSIGDIITALGSKADQSSLDETNKVVATKWTEDGEKINNWDTSYSWGDHSKAGYAAKTYVDSTFITIAGKEDVTGVHDFTNGLKIGGKLINKSKDDIIFIDANLVVRGGITMYGDENADVPSILNSIPTAGYDDIKARGLIAFDSSQFVINNGVVSVISGGAGLNEEQLREYLKKNGYINSLDGYATEMWVQGKGYATQSSLDSLSKTVSAKWTQDNVKISNWDSAYGWGNHAAAGYFLLKNFTRENIQQTLHISDWALDASKPKYKTSDVEEDTNLYFTDSRAVKALSDTLGGYLKKEGGTIEGVLKVNQIAAIDDSGLLAYKPISGWPGISQEQWGVGSQSVQGVIRGYGSLIHYDGTLSRTIWDSGNDGHESGLDADMIDGLHSSSMMKFEDYSGYVRASFISDVLAERASSKYIELWQNNKWFNIHAGKIKSHGGFEGTLTGNASSATKLEDNTGYSVWGQTFFTNGKPKDVDGEMTVNGNALFNGNISSSQVVVDGITLKKTGDGILYIDGNLVVKGGITMYGIESGSIPSIIDYLPKASYGSDDNNKGIASFDSGYFRVIDGYVTLIPENIGVTESVLNSILEGKGYLTASNYNKYALPLSGGTVSGVIKVNELQATNGVGMLAYNPSDWVGVSSAQWGVGVSTAQGVVRGEGDLIHYDGTSSSIIWDSGNDGSGSGLDADMLDGLHSTSMMTFSDYTDYVRASFVSEALAERASSTYIEYWQNNKWFNIRAGQIKAQNGFIGSLTGNADTATRLGDSSSYTAWGNTFFANGTPQSINDHIDLPNSKWLRIKDTSGTLMRLVGMNSSNQAFFGFDSRENNFDTYVDGGSLHLRSNSGYIDITSSGYVGVNKTPLYDFDVSGIIHATSDIMSDGDMSADYMYANRFSIDANNYITTSGGYLSLNTASNELSISGTSDANIHVNYRAAANGHAPSKWVWLAGSGSSYAEFSIGSLNSYGSAYARDGFNTGDGPSGGYMSGGSTILRRNSSQTTILSGSSIVFRPNGDSYSDGSMTLYSDGNLLVSGGITMYSQRSLKNVLDECGLSLSELSVIKPTRYTWKDNRDNNIHIGGIADDVQQVLPEVVYKTKDGMLTMDYGNAGFAIAASLIKPVVDHEERIKALEKENEMLKQELNKLRV